MNHADEYEAGETLGGMIMRIDKLYDAGAVKRLHTVPTVGRHTIAEHVYGALLLAVELTALNVKRAAMDGCSLGLGAVLLEVLYHDAPELLTGDMPAPAKRLTLPGMLSELEAGFYEDLGLRTVQLNTWERDIVKAADTLDLGYTCLHERRMGNRHPILTEVMTNVHEYTVAQLHLTGVKSLRSHLKLCWEAV